MTLGKFAAALGMLLWLPGHSWAQAPKFPAKPIRMLVGYAPGGGSDIMGRLNAVIVKAIQKDDFRARIAQTGADTITETPEYFRRMLKEKIERWAIVVKASKAKAE